MICTRHALTWQLDNDGTTISRPYLPCSDDCRDYLATSDDFYRAQSAASLGVRHLWTATDCPAYRTFDPASCTCSTDTDTERP